MIFAILLCIFTLSRVQNFKQTLSDTFKIQFGNQKNAQLWNDFLNIKRSRCWNFATFQTTQEFFSLYVLKRKQNHKKLKFDYTLSFD